MSEKKTGLALLREPFPPHHISKLPKPTISNDEWKKLPKGKCGECGGWHAKTNTIHLDYVGHAALTDRLLDTDPNWSWEPLAFGPDGMPAVDRDGGMWIKLTVCGVTRFGYGDAQGKTGANAVKERIGDALRNAAMRFGAALDLWHKGDLHVEEESNGEQRVEDQIIAANVKPNADAGKNLTPAQKEKCQRIASNVIDHFTAGAPDAAYDAAEEAGLDIDEKLFMITFLDSKQRNGLKAIGKERREATKKQTMQQHEAEQA